MNSQNTATTKYIASQISAFSLIKCPHKSHLSSVMGNMLSEMTLLGSLHCKGKRESDLVSPTERDNKRGPSSGISDSGGKAKHRRRPSGSGLNERSASHSVRRVTDRSGTVSLDGEASDGIKSEFDGGGGSVVSFGDKRDKGLQLPCHPVRGPQIIDEALSDVRLAYHISSKEIGHGQYGVVRECIDRNTGERLAIKSICKSRVGRVEVLRREVLLLREVSHPNIISLVDVYEDEKYIHLITELCKGGELFDRIIAKMKSNEGHFFERDAAVMIHSIIDAIRYCHDERQIVHRDLKPENLLFKTKADDSEIKIVDFGLSRHDNVGSCVDGVMKTKVGTPYYVAPEVLNRKYTKACDMWSIGVIVYILLCGYPPFYGENDKQIHNSIRIGQFDFPSPEWDDVSSSAKGLISKLLIKEPNMRLTAAEALQHPWLREHVIALDLPESRDRELCLSAAAIAT